MEVVTKVHLSRVEIYANTSIILLADVLSSDIYYYDYKKEELVSVSDLSRLDMILDYLKFRLSIFSDIDEVYFEVYPYDDRVSDGSSISGFVIEELGPTMISIDDLTVYLSYDC